MRKLLFPLSISAILAATSVPAGIIDIDIGPKCGPCSCSCPAPTPEPVPESVPESDKDA